MVLFTIPESSGLLKFGIVSSHHILCAYTACQFLIKTFPRISAALAIGLGDIQRIQSNDSREKNLREGPVG
jgi:hypothetical protein